MFSKFKESASKLADIAKESTSYIPDDLKNRIVNTVSETSGSFLNNIKGGTSSDDLTLNENEVNGELNKYKKNAKPEDMKKVDDKLKNMQKGDLEKIWDKVVLLWKMAKDPTVPWEKKAIAVGALIYTVSPIDAIPDVLPILGLTDDAGVVAAAVVALGSSLAKYAEKNSMEESINISIIDEDITTIEEDVKSMKVIVSTLAQGAYADNDLSQEEEAICFEIINKFIFSNNGIFPENKIASSSYSRKELKKIIADTFENPISLNKIASYAINLEEEESFYLYAYSVVSIDNDINDSERKFLKYFGELLELEVFDKNHIERTYKKDWLKV